MTVQLTDIFYLGRASRYSSPLNGNDRLPIVYGAVILGSNGNWAMPCIDTANFVYCFADHPVNVSNVPTIYADGVEVDSANYTFSASNDYESNGAIATVTFTSDQGNKTISGYGFGKTRGGDVPMTDIIDIIYDFLTVENDLTAADFDLTSKAVAQNICASQSYGAAGVITEDGVIWDIVTEIIGSFLGGVYKNGDGKLVFDIDDGTINRYGQATIIRRSDVRLKSARQRLKNLINQCPISYGYSYTNGEFRSHTNDTAHADLASQGIYGVREPISPFQMYWCWNETIAQKIQDVIVGKFASPVYEVEIETPNLNYMFVDRGDIVACTVNDLYDSSGNQLSNELWKVIAAIYDLAGGKVSFRLLQTGYYLTKAYLACGGYVISEGGTEWDGGIQWESGIEWSEETVYLVADGTILAGDNRDDTLY